MQKFIVKSDGKGCYGVARVKVKRGGIVTAWAWVTDDKGCPLIYTHKYNALRRKRIEQSKEYSR